MLFSKSGSLLWIKPYLVEKGKSKVSSKNATAKELVLEHVGSMGIFGEMSLIDGSSRSATAIAEEDTICIADR